MSLTTHSAISYGFEINMENFALDFDEGGLEIQATLNVGSYTLTEFAEEVERALNEVGGQVYTVVLNRTTRVLTISAPGNFTLLVATGSRLGTSVWVLAGFTGGLDLTGTNTYSSASGAGFYYTTQFILQDFVPSTNFRRAVSASVNVSASGSIVEAVTFGTASFIQGNFTLITDRMVEQAGTVHRYRPTGEQDFRDLMEFLIRKNPVEFIPDESDPSVFQKVILESTPADRAGVGYDLDELYERGLPGFYESGKLVFRVVE